MHRSSEEATCRRSRIASGMKFGSLSLLSEGGSKRDCFFSRRKARFSVSFKFHIGEYLLRSERENKRKRIGWKTLVVAISFSTQVSRRKYEKVL